MEQNVKNSLDELHKKKAELESTRNEITRLHSLYKQETKKEERLENEIEGLNKSTLFQIRLGSLLEELSTLANIPVEEINVELFFDCWHQKDSDIDPESKRDWVRTMLPGVVFDITAANGQFEFFGTSKYYESSEKPLIQADGIGLLEHSSFRLASSKWFGEKSIAPVIDRNVEDIILRIDLNLLERCDDKCWHPNDLFVNAISNCVEKAKGYQKVKKDDNQQ